jgi:uncharacterized membrane protein YfcA
LDRSRRATQNVCVELLLVIAVLLTSALSGVFGMGGGLLLMAVYASLLSAPEAMVLHGLTQLWANGTRLSLLRRHVRWPLVARFAAGALAAAMVFAALDIVVDRRVVLVALGVLPLLSASIPRRWLELDLRSTGTVSTTGFVAGGLQLLSGTAGPVLDVLFARSDMDRRGVVGTKAAVQCASHTLKVLYFALVTGTSAWPQNLSVAILVPIFVAATLGTHAGRLVLERLDDTTFRRHAGRLLVVIGLLLITRGLSAMGPSP